MRIGFFADAYSLSKMTNGTEEDIVFLIQLVAVLFTNGIKIPLLL